MVTSGSGLQLRAVSGSVALLQPQSVLMLVTPVAVEGHVDSRGLGLYLGSCWCPEPTLPLGPSELMVTSRPGLLLRARSGFVTL